MELTVVGKLDLSAQDKERLERTLELFAAACNAISQVAFAERCFHPVALQHLTYYNTRQRFNLHANFTVRAISRVAKAYKTAKANKHPLKPLTFKPQSLDLDARLFRLFSKDDESKHRWSCRPSGLGRYWAAVNQPEAESGQPALSKLSALAVSS